MGIRKTVNDVTVTGSITLGDLRWLVAQCEGKADESTVTVRESREVSANHDPAQITVHVMHVVH